MRIIVDAGGTSCSWILIDDNGSTKTITTDAIHALHTPDSEIIRIGSNALSLLNNPLNAIIHFYGAGCISPRVNGRIASLLSHIFQTEQIFVNTDMLCAAQALLKNKPGIACILGTGSNSCLYNGSEIIDNVSPLGFILGDEGSGAVLGRTLLGDILKRQFPENICNLFWNTYPLSRTEIIESVYRKESPNRFLASFTPFLKQNIECPEIEQLVINSFVSFLKRNVLTYENACNLPVSFIGSIACHFAPQLQKALNQCNLHLGVIEQNPVKGITNYYLRAGSPIFVNAGERDLNLPSVSL